MSLRTTLRLGLRLAPHRRVFAAFFLYAFSFGGCFPRLAALQRSMNLSEGELGLGLIGVACGTLLSLTFAGRLVERVGHRFTLLALMPVLPVFDALAAHASGTVTLFLCLLFTVWAISLQASVLRDTREHTKALQAQRELADKAEASRFSELRSHLTTELQRVSQIATDGHGELLNRMSHMEGALRLTLEQTSNAVAASIGEFEDRLERGDLPPPELTARGDGTPPVHR